MSKSYVRYALDTGLFLALVTIENHYPEPQPRGDNEGLLKLTDEEYRKVFLAPGKWNYADGTMTPLVEGRLSVSSLTFYTNAPNFESLHPTLDNVVHIEPHFPGLPKGEPIKVSVNGNEYEIPNYGPSANLRSETVGLFAIVITDPRVTAEQMTFYANCLAIPET